jgi:hypothetical protein
MTAADEAAVVSAPEGGVNAAGPDDVVALRRVLRAIDRCVLANHGLGFRLGPDRPPATSPASIPLAHYATRELFELWQMWAAVEALRQAADAWQRQVAPDARLIREPATS